MGGTKSVGVHVCACMHAFTAMTLPPLPAHPPFCPHLHPDRPSPLPPRSRSAAFPPCALISQPASLPLPPPSSPTTSPSSLTSSPIHTAISTPNSKPHHCLPLTLLATSSPITVPAQCPTLLGRMGEGTAGKRGGGTGMGTWVSVCVRSWVRERIRSFRSGVRASVRIAADICSGVSVGKHTGGSWRTCQHAYVGRE